MKDTSTPHTPDISLAASLKSSDTEEWWDLHFNRPIGYFWARIAIPLHITPNMITIASIIIGSAGCLLFYSSTLWINAIGMVLLVLANTFDSADGQLARLTNQKTALGRILDGLAGDIWFIIIYVVLVLRCLHEGWQPHWSIWVIGSLAGACHIMAATFADYFRNVQLFFANGKEGSEHDSAADVTERLKALKFKEKPFSKVSTWFYRNYTVQQEFFTPRLQRYWALLLQRYPGQLPADLCADVRRRNRHFMPLTNLLQFNTRVAFLFFAMLIGLPWLYFLFDLIVMNTLMLWLLLGEEKLFKQLHTELEQRQD